MKKVGIINGKGYIEDAIVKLFLKQLYDVKVSTSNILEKQYFEHLMALENSDRLHISELDITNPEAIKEFTKDCDYVVHNNKFHINM